MGIGALGRKDPWSPTDPDQSRCADWWSLPDSGTTTDDQAAGDPSTEAPHPEDTEKGPGVHSSPLPPLPTRHLCFSQGL